MSKQILTRFASGDTYFHKDFHIALNLGIEYLHQNFGAEAVREYLVQFANAWYAPLKQQVWETGLEAIRKHFRKIYDLEGADFTMNFSEGELLIHLLASPAVRHIQSRGFAVSDLFSETVITVNETICESTPYKCEIQKYDEETGGYTLRFFRRKP